MAATKFLQRKTPGVYVTEENAFPPSIVGVQTAVPAFIGYTKTAEISGTPVYMKAIKIRSLVEYEQIFGPSCDITFDLAEVTDEDDITDAKYDFKVFDPTSGTEKDRYFNLVAKGSSLYSMTRSMQLFYDNGGGECYVVSVGNYDAGTVDATKLSDGLAVIKEQVGPTMLVIPDATLLPASDGKPPYESSAFKSIAEEMVMQSRDLQDRVAILDVYGTQYVGKTVTYNDGTEDKTITVTLDDVVDQFRNKDMTLDSEYLSYGMSYFPFLNTTLVELSDVNYLNIDPLSGDDAKPGLKEILGWQNANLNNDGVIPADGEEGTVRYEQVKADIDALAEDNTNVEQIKLNQNLTVALPILLDMERLVVAKSSMLPSSGAMAGIYTQIDNNRGVWNAPANVSVRSVDSVTYKLNDKQQGDLNVPVDGKAIDAIRQFVNRGPVVWGARTLDGNSDDWRYIQVRRTIIYIEQSIKAALDPFVFAANDGKTWATVVSMVSNFLQGVWSQGGLMGATADEAFSVECGLGSTMTAQDILSGYMIVQVTLQMIRPAEFIELTFKQKMSG